MNPSHFQTTDKSSLLRARGVFMRMVVVTAVCFSLVALSSATETVASIRKPISIPAQDLGSALQALAIARDMQIMFVSDDVRDRRAAEISGDLTPEEVLRQLLGGTDLTYRFLDGKTITIFPAKGSGGTGDAPAASEPRRDGNAPRVERSAPASAPQTSAGFWSRFRLAQAQTGAEQRTAGASAEAERSKVEEVVVTAQKREQRLQDVPVPVTALSASDLIQNNLVRAQDFYNRIPGLDFAPGDRGQLNLSIRGLTTGFYTVSTVGFVVDDVPFGASSIWMSAPEIDPNELARVEVLRGPQGTLYGANSMGGLIKYVTLDPTTDRLSGRVQAGLSSIRNGNDVGYNVRGSVNVPLSESWALRASAFTRRDPGYIDNPVRGEKGINEANAYGGRLSAFWRASDAVSVKLGALIQNWTADGGPYSFQSTGFGDLQQDLYIHSGEAQSKARVFNATVKAQLGSVDLTSISAYTYQNWGGTLDDHVLLPFAGPEFPGSGFLFTDYHSGDKYSQELRLSASIGPRVDWLLGAFYTHEKYRNTFDMPAIDPATGRTVGYWTRGSDDGTSLYKEYAVFADLTFHLTDRFNVQVGGRRSDIRQAPKESSYSGGFAQTFFGVDPFVQSFPAVTDKPTTYLVTPQFNVSDDLMVYARLASGFRPGGANTFVAALNGAPPTYQPDKTQNYELGIKGSAFDRALSFDASVYRIDWKDVQLTQFPANGIGTYNGNGGKARSEGVELSAELNSGAGLTIAGWVAYNDAALAEDLPPGQFYGRKGDRLPLSARYSGNLSVEKQFPLTSSVTGSFGGTFVYVGDRKESFTGPPPAERLGMPSYTQLDLRAGMTFDTWDANLVVNNVADRRGVLRPAQVGTRGVPAVTYIQPRAVGLSVSKRF